MTKQTKRRLALLAALVLSIGALCCSGVLYFLWIELSPNEHEVFSFRRDEAIRISNEWTRTAPLPLVANIESVTTGGSMFTRGFRVTFTASASDIADWLRRSPGPREAVVTVPIPGKRHFQIAPGGGAAFAQLTVDDTQQRVIMHCYWS